MPTNKTLCLVPGNELYRKVLAGFTLKNTSLHAYCVGMDDDSVYARQVLLGGRNGPKAREFRQRLATAAGIIKPSGEVKRASDMLASEAA